MRIIQLLFLSLWLTGCGMVTLFQPKTDTFEYISFESRQAAILADANWQTQAVLSIRHDDALTLINMNWQQQDDNYTIILSAPFSLSSIKVTGNTTHVTVTGLNSAPLHAASPEILLKNTLGLQLPVSNLRYWLRGLPAPQAGNADPIHYDENDHILAFTQAGWQLAFANYQKVGPLDLPTRIIAQNADNLIKIALRWTNSAR